MKIPKINHLKKECDRLWKIACFKKYGVRGETDGETYLATKWYNTFRARGQKWLKELQKERDNKPKFFKTDIKWYNVNIKRLQSYETSK